MAVSDDDKKRFIDLIKLHTLDRRYIDHETEQRLLEEGITRFGIGLDEARGILSGVAAEHGISVARDTERRVRDILSTFATRKGMVSKRDFDHAQAIFKQFTAGGIDEPGAQRRLKKIMGEAGLKARHAGFMLSRKWFRQIPD